VEPFDFAVGLGVKWPRVRCCDTEDSDERCEHVTERFGVVGLEPLRPAQRHSGVGYDIEAERASA